MKFEGEFRGGRIWGLGECIVVYWKFRIKHNMQVEGFRNL
jgi:hypothetical protein